MYTKTGSCPFVMKRERFLKMVLLAILLLLFIQYGVNMLFYKRHFLSDAFGRYISSNDTNSTSRLWSIQELIKFGVTGKRRARFVSKHDTVGVGVILKLTTTQPAGRIKQSTAASTTNTSTKSTVPKPTISTSTVSSDLHKITTTTKLNSGNYTTRTTPKPKPKSGTADGQVVKYAREAVRGTGLPPCPPVPPGLVGPLRVWKEAPSYEKLRRLYPNVGPGGRSYPAKCKARHRVAIIIPFRDRDEHLRIFLHNLHPLLTRQQLDYGIYVVELAPKRKFNRAMLMNIGYAEAIKLYDYQCFIFHDVDLIPEDDRNIYSCPEQPRHMSAAIDSMGYRLPYHGIFGGVSALTKEQFIKVNGFSNKFFGWGGEDDDMFNRVRYHGFKLIRYPMNIARYKMLSHKKDVASPDRFRYLYGGSKRFKIDGINSLKYKLLATEDHKLFTKFKVDINQREVQQS